MLRCCIVWHTWALVTGKIVISGKPDFSWLYDDTSLHSSAVVYSFGLGEDISWEESLISDYQVDVFGFDPTPKSEVFVNKRATAVPALQSKFHFTKVGLSNSKEVKHFTLPKEEEYVSMREGDVKGGGAVIDVPVDTLDSFMKANGHTFIDLIKMDIESSEYNVLNALLDQTTCLPFGQLLIEWHERFLDDKTLHDKTKQRLEDYGCQVIGTHTDTISYMCGSCGCSLRPVLSGFQWAVRVIFSVGLFAMGVLTSDYIKPLLRCKKGQDDDGDLSKDPSETGALLDKY